MIDQWAPAALPAVVSVLLLVVPGLIVIWAGWGLRSLNFVLLAPAISVAIIGISAVIAPWLGLAWSPIPPLLLTAVISCVAFVLRRKTSGDRITTSRVVYIVATVALAATTLVMLAQFVYAFGAPEAIAQRFDNIVHLNGAQYAIETANASAFNIGATSGISFYPNGWHAVVALVAQVSGASVPVAVNAANLIIVAVVWPSSNMALAAALFGERRTAYVTAAALSTAFGAFPALFFDWGVLYPNALGYSVIPAVLAMIVLLFASDGRVALVRDSLLLTLMVAGMTLAHPNALLGAVLFGFLLAIGLAARDALDTRTRAGWIRTGVIAAAGAVTSVALWSFARTSAEHSPWPPYQNLPQAVGSALLVSPRGYIPTLIIVVLLIAGFVAVVRRPRVAFVAAPFIAVVFLFALVSGTPVDTQLRLWLTNPWYSDSNRLAALLPMTAIPVMTAGAIYIVDTVRKWTTPHTDRVSPTARRVLAPTLGIVGFITIFTVAMGSSVENPLREVRAAYTATDRSLLSEDERALLDRIGAEVPADALIIGSPRTGTSLAYSIAERQVTEKHIFGYPTDDMVYLDEHLRDIEEDPQVCLAVTRLGVDYVLDFGSFDVSGDMDPRGYPGVVNLEPSGRLVLVDSEGDDARLFRVQGC